MIAIGAALSRVPPAVWIAAALVAGGWWYGHTRYEAGQADVQAKWDSDIAKREAENKATEAVWRQAVWDHAYTAQKLRQEKKNENDAAIAGLRDGSVRVRDRFRCPLPGDTTTSSGRDTSPAGFQPEDAVSALGITAEADDAAIKLNQCIASYNALREKRP